RLVIHRPGRVSDAARAWGCAVGQDTQPGRRQVVTDGLRGSRWSRRIRLRGKQVRAAVALLLALLSGLMSGAPQVRQNNPPCWTGTFFGWRGAIAYPPPPS